ncbi:MAG: beta galactosidase jelly roll domain-containing protein, partial [Sedimentisphaerales bacterium]|nr:beta galactosidase jelly roll domain-containing protein [Sedimentisphaerales bacterium]
MAREVSRRFYRVWVLGVIYLVLLGACGAEGKYKVADGPLLTRWAEKVSPKNALPEYPRPQMVRKDWLNLNGLWDYAIVGRDAAQPVRFDGEILVPYPIESALSGVMKKVGRDNRLWYRRTFAVPRKWKDKRILLHFGAVDWDTTVWVNGKKMGNHKGGYDPFSFDITDALTDKGEQEIVLSVWDPTNAGTQPRGKQVERPGGIWYTAVTGIWQTAWLEPVSPAHIKAMKIETDIDAETVTVAVDVASMASDTPVTVTVLDGKKSISSGRIGVSGGGLAKVLSIKLDVKNAKLWSPDSPFLYGLKITLGEKDHVIDEVSGYFGMRKIEVKKDEAGVNRLFLNNEVLFQYGPLDQGWWPDGLYTAPTDEALKYDIEVLKRLGCNMLRKHVKIEPDRLYYWCDKLGLMVWQDMPSGDKYIGGNDPDITRTPESAAQFETELKAMIAAFYSHPCIIMWVPYNEGWGQWDTPRIVDMIKGLDPTRLVNNASGWTDRKAGDVHDIHSYPGPAAPPNEENRAAVLGEFGGLGLPVKDHTWQAEKNWGYR